jgi:AsmA-like C-terminal region
MDSVGRGQKIPFIAVLTNPVPKGQIETSGTFGPWNLVDPASTPVSGKYAFAHADLNTIDGLAGILSSEGTFGGPINRIHVEGTTSTPDFQVDAGGQAVPLTTTFSAVVDGSDGDTRLERVDGRFLDTDVSARGAIVQVQGAPGRRIEVDMTIDKGRIDDVLRLAMDSPTPVLRGAVHLQARLVIPAEKAKVLDKLSLRGTFGLSQAKFTSPAVQTKIVSLSRRGQGKKQDEPLGDVVSDLKGRFVIDHGVATFSELTFGVPGALVALSGRYVIRSETMAFHGSLRTKATLSQAVGGFKSLFLKPFDPFFRKKGAGMVLPIKIVGTRKDPKFGLELFGKK